MRNNAGNPPEMPVGHKITDEEAQKLNALGASADGQKVRAMLGDEERLRSAMEKGDTETLKNAMETVLRSEEGKRLLGQLGAFLGQL